MYVNLHRFNGFLMTTSQTLIVERLAGLGGRSRNEQIVSTGQTGLLYTIERGV